VVAVYHLTHADGAVPIAACLRLRHARCMMK
jgi:hypothetical protein